MLFIMKVGVFLRHDNIYCYDCVSVFDAEKQPQMSRKLL